MTPGLEAHKRTIGGKEWTVVLLPATKGLDVGRRLLKLIGPAVGSAVGGLGGAKLLDAQVDATTLGGAFSALADKLGDPDAATLIKELATTGVHCDGKEVTPPVFDLIFQGEYETLLRVAAFVVEVNFRLPLASWLDAARASVARKATRTPVQPTS